MYLITGAHTCLEGKRISPRHQYRLELVTSLVFQKVKCTPFHTTHENTLLQDGCQLLSPHQQGGGFTSVLIFLQTHSNWKLSLAQSSIKNQLQATSGMYIHTHTHIFLHSAFQKVGTYLIWKACGMCRSGIILPFLF